MDLEAEFGLYERLTPFKVTEFHPQFSAENEPFKRAYFDLKFKKDLIEGEGARQEDLKDCKVELLTEFDRSSVKYSAMTRFLEDDDDDSPTKSIKKRTSGKELMQTIRIHSNRIQGGQRQKLKKIKKRMRRLIKRRKRERLQFTTS